VHPFDIKTVLLAKHAQHVVLIHFPIALFIIGVLFDFLAQWRKQRLLAAAAHYNLLVAAIATIPVVITGILARRLELEGERLKGILLSRVRLLARAPTIPQRTEEIEKSVETFRINKWAALIARS
jgi:hypothetical protein